MIPRILALLLIALLFRPSIAAGQEISVPWRQLAFAGSNTYALAVGDGGRVLYLATDVGLQVSEDGGETWLFAGQGLEAADAPRIDALAVSPRDPSTAFAGTFAGSHAGLYVTRDLGHSWQLVWQGSRAEGISAFAIAEGEPERILAAAALREVGEDYLVTSDDGGNHWAPAWLNSGSYRAKLLSLRFQPGSSLVAYAATNEGLFVSNDGGKTWRNTGRAAEAAAVASIPGRPDWVFASSGRGLIFSRDGGLNWQSFRGPSLSVCETYAQDGLSAAGGEVPLLVATTASSCPGEPGRIYGMLLAGTRGVRWFYLDAGLPTAERPRIVIDASSTPKAYALTHDGLWVANLPVPLAPAGPTVSAATTPDPERGTENAAPVPNSPEPEELPGATPVAAAGPALGLPGGEGGAIVALVSLAAGIAVFFAFTYPPPPRRGR